MPDQLIQVLLIEDNPTDVLLLREALMAIPIASFAVTQAERLGEGLKRLNAGRFDVVLLDLSLPDSQGLETLERVCAQAPDAPVVVLTALQDEAIAIKAMRWGAQDYLIKGQAADAWLARALRYAIERKRAEEALREREALLRAVVTGAPIVLWALDRHGVFTLSEGRGLEALGLKPGQVVGQSAFEMYHDVPQVIEDSRRALAGEAFASMVEVAGLVFESWYAPLRDQSGAVVGTIGVATDVTERKRAEAALRRSEATLSGLLEVVPDGILIVNGEGLISFANIATENLFGYPRNELLGQRIEILVPERFQERHAQHWRNYAIAPKTRSMGTNLDLRGKRRDGSEFSADILLAPLEMGGELTILCLIRDITARKAAEAALQASERQLSLIYANISDVLFYLAVEPDDRFRFVSINSAFLEATGLTEDQIVGKLVQDVIPEPAHALVLGNYKEAIRMKKTVGWEEVSVYPAGKKYGEVSVTPIFDANGNCTHLIGTVHDITERKQAETALAARNDELKAMSQQLWQAAKLATMGELAASIAHELNNPLATVSLQIEDLLAEIPADAPSRRALEVIEQEVERMGRLVSNLLQFSRRGAQQISTLDVRDEIAKTLELVHHLLRQRRIAVAREFAPDAPMIQADRQQLRQLFLNLFTNASDAMPDGGTLTIRMSAVKKQVFIEIVDTGVGIAAEDLPKVMEPFFTTKPEGKGTGLGLAICRRIVQEHGGTIDIASEGAPGKGTTVRLRLPGKNKANGDFLSTL